MIKKQKNVSPKNDPERLHSLEDKDFEAWLETFPALSTSEQVPVYRKYVEECILKNKDILTFTEWRNKL